MKLKKILFIFICLFVCISTVKAEANITEVSPDGYSITATATYGTISHITLTLNHPDKENNASYYLYFIENENSAKPNVENFLNDFGLIASDKIGKDYSFETALKSVNNTDGSVNINDEWFLLKNYEYAYIIVFVSDGNTYNYEVTSSPIHIERPALQNITERYNVYVFDTENNRSLSIFPYFPRRGNLYGQHKLITKIGLVKDNEILKNIRDGKSDGYTSLLAYAKEQTALKSWDYSDAETYSIPINDFSVTNGVYYYIYTTYTDSDGIYRNLDGISLVMGKNNMLVTNLDWDILPDDSSDDEIITTGDDEVEDTTPVGTNPSTGAAAIIFVWIIGLGTIIYSVFYFRKNLSSK